MNVQTISGVTQYSGPSITFESKQTTALLPQSIIFFVKPDLSNIYSSEAHPENLSSGYYPLIGIYEGVKKVKDSTQEIFKTIAKGNQSSMKLPSLNLLRGMAEIIPISGLPLYLYDRQRSFQFNENLLKETNERQNIAGVLIDGELAITITLQELTTLMPNELDAAILSKSLSIENFNDDFSISTLQEKSANPANLLNYFQNRCLTYLKQTDLKSLNSNIKEIFTNFKKQLDLEIAATWAL